MNPVPTTRMCLTPSAAHIRLAMLACAVATCVQSPVPVRAESAQKDESSYPLTIEGEAALRERLADYVLLIQAWPAPAPLEDPDLVPTRIGMAVIVARENRIEVWTAAGLVEDATRILLSSADGHRTATARVAQVREQDSTARLECDGGCPAPKDAPAPAPAKACEDGRPLSFVVPTGLGDFVLGHTVVAGPEAPPLEALIIVPGRLPLGTPLFDPKGRPAAIVLRPHTSRTDRVLAAPLTPRPVAAPAIGTTALPADPGVQEPTGLAPKAPEGLPVMDLQ